MEVTFEAKDYSSFNFLQWYVAEQHEEEFLFNSILNKFKLLGEDGKALYYIDKDLEQLASAH
ncbi:ferritin-like protein 2 [Actinobacillus equuli]|nr:ferritin-like protein 2 [Actinobacillus equuli]